MFLLHAKFIKTSTLLRMEEFTLYTCLKRTTWKFNFWIIKLLFNRILVEAVHALMVALVKLDSQVKVFAVTAPLDSPG